MVLNSRQSWIDVVKGLGIIFVVIGHVSLENWLSNWIFSFHMPLFFSLSGFLWIKYSKQVGFRDFVVKRIKTILVPFIFFHVSLILYWIVVESHFRDLDLGPIWFLLALFCVEVLVSCVGKKYLLNIFYAVFFAVLSFSCYYVFQRNLSFLEWLLRIVNGISWYLIGCLGGLISKYIRLMNFNYKIIILLLLLIVSITISAINPGVSLWSNNYGKCYILYIWGGIVGSLLIILFCKWFLSRSRVFEFFGRNTIIVLATHEPIKRVILKCIEFVSGGGITIDELQMHIFSSVVVSFIVLLVEVYVIKVFRLIKKKSPGCIKYVLNFVR